MSERSSRRRLRLRRKRKGETFSSKLSDSGDVVEVTDVAGEVDAGDVVEVVGRLGCCVLEAAVSASVVLALLTVPTYLLLR